jgi:hypothetical protein
MSTGLLYLFGAIAALCLTVGAFWYYGKGQRKIGRQEGINEATEANDKKFTELAKDVLDDGHPYSLSGSSVAEITRPESKDKSGVATDPQREGGAGGPGGDGNGAAGWKYSPQKEW